ncbi:TetR/AcrR family transcriptional regulator [Nocardia rhizosphaerihabitans]|uniref:TetR-family transcriptional regulator n=1 Tax=Nocardia rhizosphaerihabitans TaxID=1691570 RepID=A0ABQ2KTK1_9NOCA|nr:TetR-like C-terminal domain-containing protein [Nocardia rhizosphaerihabitans]GGN92010.1 putative TetR-family transcriptional regulator [Nocardia rhizosphaerihabitans]
MSANATLRDRLIATALDLLRDEPPETLSIRKVAQALGTSHQAPYVHFGDRRRFLAAVAGAGLAQAAADAETAVATAGPSPEDRLRALVRAYVGFVDTRPHVHALAFGPLVAMSDDPVLLTAATRYWTVLSTTVAANQPAGVDEDEVARRTAMIWGTVHGIAGLAAAGKIPIGVPADRITLLDNAVHAMLTGWRIGEP